MSYQVLARKYRPQNFDEVIGQGHITDLLKNAVESQRLAHAYLFCGPRGIGKTSCARILAKSLNCEKGPTIIPCDQCSACREIINGNSMDVLEIDGASNRGIDEIRTLRENVKFAPSYGRYKIYIVDEVHMLTQEAFNALLKTLEEPPEHVKFIFATTSPQKIPATIISRCQRFDFKRIPIQTSVDILSSISKKEKFKVEAEALYAIAKAAQGSLRDALSVLDQLSAISGKGIDADDVFSMLGLVETQMLFDLADALARRDCPSALQVLEKVTDKGKDMKQLNKDITEHFRNLMIIKVGGKALSKMVDYPIVFKDMLLAQCDQFTLKEILGAIDMFIETQETSRITESMRMPLEIAFAKLTYQEDLPDAKILKQPPKKESTPKENRDTSKSPAHSPLNVLKDEKGEVDNSGLDDDDADDELEDQQPLENSEAKPDALEDVSSGDLDIEKIKRSWDALTHATSKTKMSIATFLQDGVPVDFDGSRIVIGFDQSHCFHKESLESKENIQIVEEIFTERLKTQIYIKYALLDEDQSMPKKNEDPVVKSALDTFDGKVISRWHEDNDS